MQYIATTLALFAAANAVALPAEQADQGKQSTADSGLSICFSNTNEYCPDPNPPPGPPVPRPRPRPQPQPQFPQFPQFPQPADGDQNGPYRSQCQCTLYGQPVPGTLSSSACNDLNMHYPNLQFNSATQSCYDANQRGLEQNGFAAACSRQGSQYGSAVSGVCY
ncbi:Hypothetical predicted protein [Lecanosticta acicola]|uniref:Uncharacterized protein n=1 Tax=Lecanosticta acicola TaxID=111012 RepID=A0AAI9EFJ2_9PEZI|nr:Hypothetical predicted protein [Lecanosticta acicola]